MARENFNELLAFVTVARAGSFTRAAAELQVSQSALSHTIRALEQRFSTRISTGLECAAFGLAHLFHHGLFVGATGWTMRPLSGGLWVLAMGLTAALFAALRRRSGSLVPAIAAHAAFNAAMNGVIFSILWH